MIGITASLFKGKLPNMVSESRYHVSQDYVDALSNQGALSCILPVVPIERIPEVVANLSGLILSGGEDLAAHFSVKAKYLSIAAHCQAKNAGQRDWYEIALCREALRQGKPVLGICRGMQVLNIALGGTLNQEINHETKKSHMQTEKSQVASHGVQVFPGTVLSDIVQTPQLAVNSFHHQSIDLLGKQLEIAAIAEDGIIESIEYQGGSFALGIQWHPEAMADTDEKMQRIFEYFVEEVRFANKTLRSYQAY